MRIVREEGPVQEGEECLNIYTLFGNQLQVCVSCFSESFGSTISYF